MGFEPTTFALGTRWGLGFTAELPAFSRWRYAVVCRLVQERFGRRTHCGGMVRGLGQPAANLPAAKTNSLILTSANR